MIRSPAPPTTRRPGCAVLLLSTALVMSVVGCSAGTVSQSDEQGTSLGATSETTALSTPTTIAETTSFVTTTTFTTRPTSTTRVRTEAETEEALSQAVSDVCDLLKTGHGYQREEVVANTAEKYQQDGFDLTPGAISPGAAESCPDAWDETGPRGGWNQSVSTSPFDDSTQVIIWLPASTSFTDWLGNSVTPELQIQCVEDKTDVNLELGTTLEYEPRRGYARHTIRLRFDDEAAFNVISTEATDPEIIFLPKPIDLAKKMLDHETLTAGFVPYDSSPEATVFTLRGIQGVIRPLRDACSW